LSGAPNAPQAFGASHFPPPSENMVHQTVTLSLDDLARTIQIVNGTPPPPPPPPPSGLGNPGPLGLGAFALTTMVLSTVNAKFLISPAVFPVVLPIAFFYGGVAQFVAGLYEFKSNNTFGATAFCSYGAFWVSFAFLIQVLVPTIPAGEVHKAEGLFLLAWTIFTTYMLIAAWRVSMVIFVLFAVLEITFIFLTVGALVPNETCTIVGGFLGLVTAGIAWYGSAAVVINSTYNKAIFPIGVNKNDEGKNYSFADTESHRRHHHPIPSTTNGNNHNNNNHNSFLHA